MATKQPKEDTGEEGKKLVPLTGNTMPAELAEFMEAEAGAGVSTDAKDNMVPLIYILQPMSPQALKRNPAYMEGAEAGMVWLRNADDPLVSGDDGIMFQPCFFDKEVVEWAPRDSGQGFVARHRYEPDDHEDAEALAARLGATRRVDPEHPNRTNLVLPNGNSLVETRYHIGHVIRGTELYPYVIPLSSTGHSFSREWMGKMNTKRTPSGKPAAAFSHVYRLTTRYRQNQSGEWFVFAADSGVPVWKAFPDPAHYNDILQRGKSLKDAFASGAKVVEAEHRETGGGLDTSAAEAAI